MDFDSNNVFRTTSVQVATPTVAQVPMMPITMPIFVSPKEKMEKFNRLNFKRWQHKMLFYITTLNLANFFLLKMLQILKKLSMISKSSVLWMLGNILTLYVETMT